MNQKYLTIIFVIIIIITVSMVGYFVLVKKSTPVTQQTSVTQQTNGKNVTLEIDGYGYTIGDIVGIKLVAPIRGDIVVFDPFKNKSMCLGMGPSMALGKIIGVPDDSVQIQKDGLKLRTETIPLERDYSNRGMVFGGIKYKNPPANITLKNGEYLLDKWVGLECFGGEIDETGSSITYNRFTVNQEAILGVIENKIGHDDQAEKEFKGRIY